MSNLLLDLAFELPITGARKSVLIALADHADDDGGSCFPSLPRIALFAGVTVRGARKALRDLEMGGLVRTVHATGNRSQYKLVISAMTPEPGSPPKPCAPRNLVPPTPELGSSPPRNYVPQPRNQVPSNLQEPPVQPPGNLQVETRDHISRDSLFGFEAPASPGTPPPQPKATRKASARQRTETQIDPAWQPDAAGLTYAAGKGITDFAGEIERFVNWHAAKATLSASWAASWRTWCMNSVRFRTERTNSNGAAFAAPSANTHNHGGLLGAVKRMYR